MGFSWARVVIDKNLDEQQKLELTRQTNVDYVMVEHNHNNMLITDYYQKEDDLILLDTEQKKINPWYQFWK